MLGSALGIWKAILMFSFFSPGATVANLREQQLRQLTPGCSVQLRQLTLDTRHPLRTHHHETKHGSCQCFVCLSRFAHLASRHNLRNYSREMPCGSCSRVRGSLPPQGNHVLVIDGVPVCLEPQHAVQLRRGDDFLGRLVVDGADRLCVDDPPCR